MWRTHSCAVLVRAASRFDLRRNDRNLPVTSGTRFASTLNGVNDHPGDVVLAKFRTDQHVIQVRIVPIAPEIHPDVVGALLIGQSNQLLDMCGTRQALPDRGYSLQPRSENEDVKNVLHLRSVAGANRPCPGAP